MVEDLKKDEEKEAVIVMRRYADKERRIAEFDAKLDMDWILGRRPNIKIYNKMLRDPGISFPLHMLKLPLSRARLTYTNPDRDIQRFVEENLKELHYTIHYDALTALDYGYSAFERRFQHKNGLIYYKEFIHLDPEYIWIRVDPKTYKYDGLRQRVSMKQVDIPAAKTFVMIHEFHFSKMYGRAQIDYAYVPWLLDKEFYRYHGVALQEFGLPTLLGRAPDGKRRVLMPDGKVKDISNIEFMQMLGQTVRSDSVIVLPSGEDFSLGSLFEKKIGWDYNKDHEFLDLKKSLAILLPPELWHPGTTGSYAKSRIQSFWFEQSIGGLLDELKRFVEKYIIKPIVLMNFWDGKEMPPLGTLHGEPPSLYYEEFAQKLVIEREKARAKSDPGSNILEWSALYKMMRIPLAEPGIEKFEVSDLPTSQKMLEELCRKVYRKGIEIGKEELAFKGYVPIGKERNETLKKEAAKLKHMLANTANSSLVVGVVLSRLKAEGREDTLEFFHDSVVGGNYDQLNKEYKDDTA